MGNRELLLSEYLKTARVLIVDQNSSARVGLKKLMVSLGMPLPNIYQAGSIDEAKVTIRAHSPEIVLCEYQVRDSFALDLLQKIREENPETIQKNIFILVTSNTSQSAVAQAAEEDVDAYILKPYTIDGFTQSLARAVEVKVHPSEYLKLIQHGKELLNGNQLDQAAAVFTGAKSKDSAPSLACFYEGLTFFRKSLIPGAQSSYEQGLSISRIHYKCLVGLFDLLNSLKRHDAAYDVMQKIVRFFPANPKRLSTVFRLAIQTKHYADVTSFYDEFTKIDQRTDELVKCVCAALIICAKYFFSLNDENTALDLVRKASVTAAGNHSLLRSAVELLVENNQVKDANAILKRFESPVLTDVHYSAATLLVEKLELAPELVAAHGRELIKAGLYDPTIYQVTIECLKTYGKKDLAAELTEDFLKRFPQAQSESSE